MLNREMLFGLLQKQSLPYVPGCASKKMPAGWGPCTKKGSKRARDASNSSKKGQAGAASTTAREAASGRKQKKPKNQK